MSQKTGSIQVSTENIFPIIRKWLYSDHDIFVRELISNATDAIYKYDRLVSLGEIKETDTKPADFRIDVVYDQAAGTLSFSDNGIGMTLNEIDQYINDIAYSGALDFVNRFESANEGDGIIGHFGLGFYSAFMVADRVSIDTLSYQEGARAAHWHSENGMDYVMLDGDDIDHDERVQTQKRQTRGTTITIHLSDEAKETFTGPHLRDILDKYCAFMARPIYFNDVVGNQTQTAQNEQYYQNVLKAYEERKQKALEQNETFEEPVPTPYPKAEAVLINDQKPLWLESPSQCSDDDYKQFYKKACHEFKDPLFWIHLNMDYPFNLKGILYFPEMENRYQTLDGRIKLYSNQVFVADNMKDVIPDFLFLLKGFIDCPDIPLNVSRSYLQNDGYIKKLSAHIVKKVADQLKKIFESDRESYERYWDDIHIFIKYGIMRDDKFYDRVQSALLFKTYDGHYVTLDDLGETIYYTVDPETQVAYISRAIKRGLTVVVLNDELDIPYIGYLESKRHPLKFVRIDTDLENEAGRSDWLEPLKQLFTDMIDVSGLTVEVKSMGEHELPVVLVETEESRRALEMRKTFEKMQGTSSDMNLDALFPVTQCLQVNTDSEVIQSLLTMKEDAAKQDKVKDIAQTLYDLARLSHGSLKGDHLDAYLKRSVQLLDLN